MSETDNKFKQRIIGALVLIALAIIFLPMLFSSKDEHPLPRVEVPTPPAPVMPPVPDIQVEPVQVPEPVEIEEITYEPVAESESEFVLIESEPVVVPQPEVIEPKPQAQPAPVEQPVVVPAPVAESKFASQQHLPASRRQPLSTVIICQYPGQSNWPVWVVWITLSVCVTVTGPSITPPISAVLMAYTKC